MPIAVSIGDTAGIGPEVAMCSLAAASRIAPIVLFGPAEYMSELASMLGVHYTPRIVADTAELKVICSRRTPPDVSIIDIPEPEVAAPGRPCGEAALASLTYVKEAAQAALAGAVRAIVTGPVNKAAICAAGREFSGHTEYLAELTGADKVVMMFAAGGLRIALVTSHIPISKLSETINSELIFKTLAVVDEHLDRWFDIRRPRIAVCGLNPHAGEGGHMGAEEEEKILPAVNAAIKAGIRASGPFPADSLFKRAGTGEFDCVVAMYHDQGLIPAKTSPYPAVNVTLGLPIVRTSVDHGTAYDIAGKGVADTSSFIEAVKLAARIADRVGARTLHY